MDQIESQYNPSFTHLKIEHLLASTTDLSHWEQLGTLSGRNPYLKKLSFELLDTHVPVTGLNAFFQGLSHNKSIEEISFFGCTRLNFNHGEAFEPMYSFLRENNNIKALNISASFSEDSSITCSIVRSCPSLERIILWDCGVNTHDKQTELFSLLHESPKLVRLHWVDDGEGPSAARQMSCLLQDPESKSNHVFLECSENANDHFAQLFQSLEKNKKLKNLLLMFGDDIPEIDWEPVKKMLCFENHTLERLSFHGWVKLTRTLKSLLLMNRSDDKENIRIRKCLDFDFLCPSRELDGKLFENGFKRAHLAHLLASTGTKRSKKDLRSESYRLSALYRLIQNKPLLVVGSDLEQDLNGEGESFESTKQADRGVLGKRKRIDE